MQHGTGKMPLTVKSSSAIYQNRLVFQPNTSLLNTDTTLADGINNLFVVDALKHSHFQFQFNRFEGVPPPPGSAAEKPVIVSFVGTGAGLKQFRQPSGEAFFDDIVYLANKGNNRIARYKLTTDFE